MVAHESLELGIGVRAGRNRSFVPAEPRQGRLVQQLAHPPVAAHQPRRVVRVGQKVRVDARRRQRVGVGQGQAAAAVWAQQAHMARITVAEHRGAAVVDQFADHEVQLQVGDRLVGAAADEPARLGEVRRQQAGPLLPPLPDAARHAHHAAGGQSEAVLEHCAFDHRNHVDVIVQVASHARQGVQQRDAVPLQFVGRADARQQQQLRRLQRAGRQQHLQARPNGDLLAPAQALHADRAAPVEQHAGRLHAGQHRQVRPLQVRCEVSLGGAETLAKAVRHLVRADAFLLRAVEVGIDRPARLPTGLDEGFDQWIRAAQVHHVERPADAVVGIGTALVVFGPPEPRQHVVPAPALVAQRRPVVVVARVAARIDHRVDRARAAQHLAARLVAAAAVQAGLRHGLKAPAAGPRARHQRQPGGAVDQHAGVGRAGFEQRHRDGRVLAQSRCQHAAGAAAADDHVVEVQGHLMFPVSKVIRGRRLQGRGTTPPCVRSMWPSTSPWRAIRRCRCPGAKLMREGSRPTASTSL